MKATKALYEQRFDTEVAVDFVNQELLSVIVRLKSRFQLGNQLLFELCPEGLDRILREAAQNASNLR